MAGQVPDKPRMVQGRTPARAKSGFNPEASSATYIVGIAGDKPVWFGTVTRADAKRKFRPVATYPALPQSVVDHVPVIMAAVAEPQLLRFPARPLRCALVATPVPTG